MATILIVEDRPVDRKLLATVLKSANHKVLEAADGGEAFDLVSSRRPDLVVSDILMPSVDGYELVQRIRETPALAHIPVVFYTATYHEREARALAAQCGVAAIMTKPSTPTTILQTVDRALATVPPASQLSKDRARFNHDHLQVISATFASRMGELEAGEQRMAAIVDIARELTAEREPATLLKKVCSAAREVTLAQHALLGLLDSTQHETEALFASGLEEGLAADLKPPVLTGTPLDDVVSTRKPSRIGNFEPGRETLSGAFGPFPTYSVLAVPLATPTRVLGWLALHNKLGADGFSDRDEDVAVTLATHAAIAFENARLYNDERRHAEQLEREIEDRRRVEDVLRQAQERTEYALASAQTGIWEMDLVGGGVTWSRSTAALFGLSPSQAPRTSAEFLALLHPDDAEDLRRAMEKATDEHGEFRLEFRSIWPDGSLHWQDSRVKVLSEAGRARRVLGIGIDITERKVLELQFRQAQKMEAIGLLAGGVAHDFNNLLTAILGNANLLQDRLQENGTAPGTEIGEIIRAAERAAALTTQLLAFSRKQLLQPTRLDLNALVEEMSQMLRRLIGEHVQLSTVLAADLSAVRADATQISQVLMNLVVNARDAMPSGGRLTIETANVELDGRHPTDFAEMPAGRYALLAVSDTGSGMNAETRRRLFEPFFTTKERGKGTGLGLATVYGIIKQSGGYIWVFSEVGEGTTFKIYLPVVGGPAGVIEKAAPVPATGPAHAAAGRTILLVEDEDSVRQLTTLILERAGHHVHAAQSAKEAVAIFDAHADEIDLLITDVVMPGASGPALLQQLLQRRPTLHVLYMSGYADDALRDQGPIQPQAAFLQKPFSAEQLIRKVRDATSA